LALLEARIWNLLKSRKKLRERFSKEVTLFAITAPDEILVEKVMSFIEANMSEPTLIVEELSKEVSMTILIWNFSPDF